jgi:hypothetical protein
VFGLQASMGLISLDETTALPVVPLAWLFVASSGLLLSLLLWQLYRRARPGSLLLTACLVGPLAKLGLEQLRLYPRPPTLMLGIPCLAASASLLVLLLRSRTSVSGDRPTWRTRSARLDGHA